jgi:hypothetical protein
MYLAMQRLLILFVSVASFASAAHAQPAGTQPPAEPPSPSSEPTTAPTAAPPDAAKTPDIPAPAAPAVAAKPGDELPKRLSVGKESPGAFLSFGVNFQGWFIYDETIRKGMTEDVNLSTSTFRIRRLELSLGGEIIPKFVRYRTMFDPSRARDTLTTFTAVNAAGQNVTIRAPTGAISALQDFYITFLSDVAEVSIGQFKNQVSWDGFNSAAKIIMPERAFIANLVGGQRDLGIRIDKTFPKFMYSIGFFNGAGQNNLDTNNEKQVGLRLEVYPVKGLTIAGVTYDSIGYRSRAGTKDRWEGDLRYDNANFLFQSEFIRTRDVFADGAKPVNTQGFYAALAYTLKGLGSGNWKGDLQPVVRVGYYDPNIDADVDPSMVAASSFGGNDERTDFEVGLNYYLRGHEMKFQLSYDRQQFDQSDIKPANNEVILATQVWY